MTTTITGPSGGYDPFDLEPIEEPSPPSPSRLRRLLRGPATDPSWVRPTLLVLLAGTAFLYLWDLRASGWANTYYSAAVQAGTKSWKAFFFGSLDSSNFITVDKPPAALWVMELSARIFGLNSWSVLVPQALEGVAAVGVLYATVRRWATPAAGLIAGAVLAMTPVAALMFRYNNPDSLLVLLLCGGAYAITRAIEKSSTRWLVVAFALVGFGFITKMLQAYLVVPAFGVAYLIAAQTHLSRRIRQLAIGAVALVIASGWWVAAVMLTPASARPYIGGSQDNSLFNLIFGYNGFGRITGNETGSVGGGGGANQWGPTGITRLFGSDMGTQISWLLPAALILLAGGVALTWRARRTDRTRASLIIWGGWLLLTGAVFSFSKGIIHPYYTVALAPAIGALVGIGATLMWAHRSWWPVRLTIAGTVLVTAVWTYALLDRDPGWHPALRLWILMAGLVASFLLVAEKWIRVQGGRLLAAVVLALVAFASIGGSAAYALSTVATPHTGAIPYAGPAGSSGAGRGGGPGGGAAGGRGGGPGGAGGGGLGGGAVGGPPGSAGFARTGANGGGFGPAGGGFPGGGPFGGGAPGGSTATGLGGGSPGGSGAAAGGASRKAGAFAGRGGGGIGGLLNGSTSNSALTAALKASASEYTWVAAVVDGNQAAGYQLASGEPVLAVGGFNGTDPWPTLSVFENYVAEHKIHYFIASGGAGGGPAGRSSSNASSIASWVESHFESETIGGVTVYDLTSSASGS